jgi:hypothetical protein
MISLTVLPSIPAAYSNGVSGEHQNPWAVHAAAAGEALASFAAMAGYQRTNISRSVPSRVFVRVCRSRWAPFFDHCICCFLAKRLLTTVVTVDSAKDVAIRSP